MSMENPQQLLLGVKLNDDATFENFFVSSSNHQLLQFLRADLAMLPERNLCLWGSNSVGKTHMLQAMCHTCAATDKPSIYLPMKECLEMGPDILEGLEHLALICLDDIDEVLGIPKWEQALFNLYNRARETGAATLITGNVAPKHLSVSLPDLRSRLQSAMVFQLHSLNDPEKASMIKMRATHMGIELPDSVVDFVLQRSDRGVSALLDVLHQLDRQSLELKRRITIPLVKQTMNW